jgi:ribonuclease P protein component
VSTTNSLGKKERLKSRKRLDQLFQEGKSFVLPPFRIYYQFHESPGTLSQPLQAGFGVSKRNFRKSVHRNRIKRLIRESYRTRKQPLLNRLNTGHRTLDLFLLYTGRELPEFSMLAEKMQLALDRIEKIIHETTPPAA